MPKDRQFVGLNAYKDLLQTDCDMVILATPPGFRPLHFEAAVKAGKHIFAEKPVAVDAAGVRKFLAANEEAKQKGLAVAIGLQRRHERSYMETVKAIQDGAIGDIILARAYWNGRKPWFKTRQDGQTEMEYQMRNWYNFVWTCGDHIVEQHIHNLDVINWIKNDYPATAQGQGGCMLREKDFGEIFDHHMVEFTYGDGTVLLSECRHQPDTWQSVTEYVHGTKGRADVSGAKIYDADGKMIHDFNKRPGGPPRRPSAGASRPVCRNPRRQAAAGRRMGREEHDDRHLRPHGDLLGPDAEVGPVPQFRSRRIARREVHQLPGRAAAQARRQRLVRPAGARTDESGLSRGADIRVCQNLD